MSGDDRDAPKLSECPREVAACVERLRCDDVRVTDDARLVAWRTVHAPGWYAITSSPRRIVADLFDSRLAAPVERNPEAERLAEYAREERARWLARRRTWADLDEQEGSAA